jgi:hypothetical protein
LFEVHADLTHGPKYLLESDDLSTDGFLGIEDLEFDSDFTIRTIPLEFEVKRRCSIQYLSIASYLPLIVSY